MAIALALFLAACGNFNFPFTGKDVLVIGGSTSPQLQFVRISSDKNSLERVQTSAPGTLTALSAGAGLLVGTTGTQMFPWSALGNTLLSRTSVPHTSNSLVTVSPDSRSVYLYNLATADLVNVYSVSGGTVSTSPLQTKTLTISDEVTAMQISADGSLAILGDNASDSANNLHVLTRSTDGTLGSLVGSALTNPEAVNVIRPIPALGTNVYLATLGGGSNTRVFRATSSALSILYSMGVSLVYVAVHPTQPWVYTYWDNTTIRRYVVSTTAETVAASYTVSSRSINTQLYINSDGDRLLELADGNKVRMYSIASDGSLTQISSLSVTAGILFEMLTPARSLP